MALDGVLGVAFGAEASSLQPSKHDPTPTKLAKARPCELMLIQWLEQKHGGRTIIRCQSRSPPVSLLIGLFLPKPTERSLMERNLGP